MPDIRKLSDNELIQLLKKDDNSAFTEIYNRYADSLAGFAGAKLYHLEDARDILHDIFIKLWEDRYTLVITSNLKSYLFSAVRYRVIDKIRRKVTRQDYSSMIQAASTANAHGADEIFEVKELQKNIDHALKDLPSRTKQIYELSRNKCYTISEIAQMLNISEQTVKNQLTTALKHIRQSVIFTSTIAFLYWCL